MLNRNTSEIIEDIRNAPLLLKIITIITVLAILWIYLTSPVRHDEFPYSIIVEEGTSLKQIAQELKESELIRSPSLFSTLVILQKGDAGVIFGEYLFDEDQNIFTVVDRLTKGEYGIDTKSVRIPEGATLFQIAELMEQEFVDFKADVFIQLAGGKEGRLFPDTYFFLENVKAHEVLEVLESTFEEKISTIRPLIEKSGLTEEEVVIMASIIEKEATHESRQKVGNILWKRIAEDMPLQVDATFVYSIGKGTFDLTKADLTNDEDPYNTYIFKGLPPTAISNPSLESLKAAANPQPTEHLFFLTGHDGEMYYAETFDGHKSNRARFLY